MDYYGSQDYTNATPDFTGAKVGGAAFTAGAYLPTVFVESDSLMNGLRVILSKTDPFAFNLKAENEAGLQTTVTLSHNASVSTLSTTSLVWTAGELGTNKSFTIEAANTGIPNSDEDITLTVSDGTNTTVKIIKFRFQ